MCRVSFCILLIWVCLILSITLDLVLRQFRFSLRSFNWVHVFLCVIMPTPFFTTLFPFDRFYRFALIRFTFRIGSLDSVLVKEINISTLNIVIAVLIRLCISTLWHYECSFNQIGQFNIMILCKYSKVNMHFLHTVLDIFPMDLTRRIC